MFVPCLCFPTHTDLWEYREAIPRGDPAQVFPRITQGLKLQMKNIDWIDELLSSVVF